MIKKLQFDTEFTRIQNFGSFFEYIIPRKTTLMSSFINLGEHFQNEIM